VDYLRRRQDEALARPAGLVLRVRRDLAAAGFTYGQRAGTFDFIPHVPGLTRSEVSWWISDHYPLRWRIPAGAVTDLFLGFPTF
jgi:hypothetical protein